MEGSVLAKSMELVVVGMGMTFSFLVILVGIMKILQFAVDGFLNKWFPLAQSAQAVSAAPITESKIKVAIALAVARNMSK